MMTYIPEGDDQAEKRLADYSDAIARGETPNDRGIDPIDAALVRELHRVGRSVKPNPKLVEEFFRTLNDIVTGDIEPPHWEQQARGPAPLSSISTAIDSSSPSTVTPLPFGAAPGAMQPTGAPELPPVVPLQPTSRAKWRLSVTAIAAGLLLFLAAASLLFFAANRDNNENATIPVAGQGTEQPTAANVIVGSPSVGAAITAPISEIEAFPVFDDFVEQSSAGRKTPVAEGFRTKTVNIPWDGEGIVVVSGCSNRFCSLILDDELHLTITNAEGKEETRKITDNGSADGESQALSVVLNVLFRPGDNVVEASLFDRAGDERGTKTPIYILILK
jgi:hypothetical protein